MITTVPILIISPTIIAQHSGIQTLATWYGVITAILIFAVILGTMLSFDSMEY